MVYSLIPYWTHPPTIYLFYVSSQESILFGAIRTGRPEEVTAVLEGMDEASQVEDLRNPKLVALAAEGSNRQLLTSIFDVMLDRFTAAQVKQKSFVFQV